MSARAIALPAAAPAASCTRRPAARGVARAAAIAAARPRQWASAMAAWARPGRGGSLCPPPRLATVARAGTSGGGNGPAEDAAGAASTNAAKVEEGEDAPQPLFRGESYFYGCALIFTFNWTMMGVKGADFGFFLALLALLGLAARTRARPTAEWRELPQGLPWTPKVYNWYRDAGVVLGLALPTVAVLLSFLTEPTDIYYVLAPLSSVICMQTFLERIAYRYMWAPVLRIASRVAVALKAMSALTFTLRNLWWWGPPTLLREKLVLSEYLIAFLVVLSLLNFVYWGFYLTWDLMLGVLPAMLRPEYDSGPAPEAA